MKSIHFSFPLGCPQQYELRENRQFFGAVQFNLQSGTNTPMEDCQARCDELGDDCVGFGFDQNQNPSEYF